MKRMRIILLLTLNAWRNGFRSFISFASDTLPSPLPSDVGSTSKTIMSSGFVSKGSPNKAKNPGFNTAHTWMPQKQFLLESYPRHYLCEVKRPCQLSCLGPYLRKDENPRTEQMSIPSNKKFGYKLKNQIKKNNLSVRLQQGWAPTNLITKLQYTINCHLWKWIERISLPTKFPHVE